MATVLKVKNNVLSSSVTKMTCDFKGYSGHKGVDLVPGSTSDNPHVLAWDSGTVIFVQNFKGNNYENSTQACGTTVAIKHSNGAITRYMHMMYDSLLVKKGDKVIKGQKLGIIGNTGNSSGRHLHFDISFPTAQANSIRGYFINEYRYYVDPKPYLTESTEVQYKVKQDVNIRSSASLKGNLVGEYKKGEVVSVIATSGVWLKTDKGWCNNNNGNFFKKV